MNVWRLSWRVSQHEPRSFWLGWAAFIVFFTVPAATGYVLGRGFGALADGDTDAVYRWALLLVVVEAVRMAAVHYGAVTWTKSWVHMQTLLRANLLTAQVASGGPEAGQPVGSAGEAITHFRDDTEDVTMLVDGMVDVSGGVVFTVLAGLLLGAADPTAAAVLLLPLGGVVLATRTLDARIKAYRAADRVATAKVTGLVGDMMAAATTVKVNDATEPMLDRLRVLVDRRRETAVRDHVLDESVYAFSTGAADVGLGLVLLVSAGAIASGTFDLGTLALFVAYLGWLSFLPRMIGRMLARHKQAGVAFDRMRKLVADTDAANLVTVAAAADRGRASAASRPADRRPAASPAATAGGRRPHGPVPGRRRHPRHRLPRRPRQLRRRHRAGRRGQEHDAARPARSGLAGRGGGRGAVERRATRRSGRVPGAAERGVPAPGAATGLRLGPRQRRPRPGAER